MTAEYILFNPSGNITALVTSFVDASERIEIADEIMKAEPSCEQVGFVAFKDEAQRSDFAAFEGAANHSDVFSEADVVLEMAGGEFCGNACLCAAIASYMNCQKSLQESGKPRDEKSLQKPGQICNEKRSQYVKINDAVFEAAVECVEDDVRFKAKLIIDLNGENSKQFYVSENCDIAELKDKARIVYVNDITHIVTEDRNTFEFVERSIKPLCSRLNAKALGDILLEKQSDTLYQLTPIVYVDKANTLFHENSCASGSIAAGLYLKQKNIESEHQNLELRQSGGSIFVQTDMTKGELILSEEISRQSESY